MFQKINKNALKKLSSVKGETLLSIYTPLQNGMKGHKFNQSQLHNLRSELKQVVSSSQHTQLSTEIETILQKIDHKNESLGIAMFYDGTNVATYMLPFTPVKMIEIDTSYNVAQIRDYYALNKAYYVLAISKKGSKLYQGDMDKLKMVPVDGLGQDIETTLNIDELGVTNLQNHPLGNGGNSNVGFHGHGGYKDIKKNLFDEYLRVVDKKILHSIKDKSTPLILVAVDYGQSAFKHISKYPSIFKKGVSTNPDEMSPIELHQRTFPLINSA